MSSALTFYFKEIFPTQESFTDYLKDSLIADTSNPETLTFGQYIYKLLYRRFHNENVQYDTPDDFKNDLANILEDNFEKFQAQTGIIKKLHNLSEEDITQISEALANQANNPNSSVDNPKEPLGYISSQAYTLARDNKLQAYLRALNNIPTKLINELLISCQNLFKKIIPQQIFVYKGGN